MKLKSILAALVLGAAAGGASAGVVAFDGLTDFINGGGFPLAAGMRYDGADLVYEEAGMRVTLHAPDAAPGQAHVGDGTFAQQTWNWHDGLENGDGTWVTLARADGGRFDLLGFDYLTDLGTVLADGVAVGTIADAGSWTARLAGIRELRLDAGSYNQIDNVAFDVAAAAVPLPGTLALLLGGALAGRLARRRRG
jgi:hypothetical protein